MSRRVCNNTIIIVLEGVVSSHQEEQIQEGQAVDMEDLFMVTKEVNRHSATATEGIKLYIFRLDLKSELAFSITIYYFPFMIQMKY